MLHSIRTLESRRAAARILVFCALAFACLTPSSSFGQGRGGGSSGGGDNGGGTVYFINGSTTWSMDADGGNVTQLKNYGYFTYPSRDSHNGYRWFLAINMIPGFFYSDGTTQRMELFAYRADFDPTLNNSSETKVQLTDDDTLQPLFQWFQGPQWLLGDRRISFKARRWSAGTVVEGGLYAVDVAFREDGNILGLVGPPTAPTLAFALDSSGLPVLNMHSWDPTGNKVVYNDNVLTGLWVADLTSSARTQIFVGPASYPNWSPDGSKILFGLNKSIYTLKPTGAAVKEVIRPTYLNGSTWSTFGHPCFSGTGSHILCIGWNGTTDDLFRATSTGGSLTNITNTPTVNEFTMAWR